MDSTKASNAGLEMENSPHQPLLDAFTAEGYLWHIPMPLSPKEKNRQELQDSLSFTPAI